MWGQLIHRGMFLASVGTPPRMWGQHHRPAAQNQQLRNTPTYVGTTRAQNKISPVGKEHPHVCGDNGRSPHRPFVGIGTPPRMWGQLHAPAHSVGDRRNTPTYVGTTRGERNISVESQEHPHVCGDNVDPGPGGWRGVRNTPTYVGTTPPSSASPAAVTEHPHVCGDNKCASAFITAIFGTPPRMWGQLLQQRRWNVCERNTPTYVGTTAVVQRLVMLDKGTPPRMWGQR